MALFGPNDRMQERGGDDDGGDNLNARINTILDPGVYYVEVWLFNNGITGDYTITVREE